MLKPIRVGSECYPVPGTTTKVSFHMNLTGGLTSGLGLIIFHIAFQYPV